MKHTGPGIGFVVELVAFVAFACSVFLLPLHPILQIISSVILFIVLVTFWSTFMAPKAPKKFSSVTYYIVKVLIYAVSAYVIFHFYGLVLSIAFVVLAVLLEPFLYKHNLAK